jgi:hypothetical protein
MVVYRFEEYGLYRVCENQRKATATPKAARNAVFASKDRGQGLKRVCENSALSPAGTTEN